jgi:hypothetical protein
MQHRLLALAVLQRPRSQASIIPREDGLPLSLAAARRPRFRIWALAPTSVRPGNRASRARRQTRVPNWQHEIIWVLQRNLRLRAGTGSERLVRSMDRLRSRLEVADRGCHKIQAIARTSVPYRNRISMACLRTCALRRQHEAVSLVPRKLRVRDGTGSGRRECPLVRDARQPHLSRVPGIASVNRNALQEVSVEHVPGAFRRRPATAALSVHLAMAEIISLAR